MATKAAETEKTDVITLAVDTGGTGIKMITLDSSGKPTNERVRVPTPSPATTTAVLAEFEKVKTQMPPFDRVSVGFPGVIKHGTTYTAANLDPSWVGFPLQATLEKQWKKPVRVCNDAAVQGYAAIKGKGVELMLTLGTGLGSSLFTSGHLCPGLELAHHIWRKKDRTYEDYLGKRGYEKYGVDKWNSFLQEAIENTAKLFNWDTLYLGGGNSKKISFKLPENVQTVSNEDGLLGGVALWRDEAML
ncbi:Polyphosphate glucokinase [Acidisarcina polymorpha]|uniref:Polyphosphate glucokinase n=1 Tax=Acidisarcina polymorpha TaxID=2211140 RepID=A0A2Z5FY79_9BACT|nr:ROK family protein [Acidisarcina polymorpha]AXC11818.1 Polyphosphate glucokinase [Acidisarcina polymorpha]